MSNSDNHGPYKDKGETVDVVDDRLESTTKDTSDESDEPKYKDKQWLHHQYHTMGKSTTDIADICGVDTTTVRYWFEKHDLKFRDRSEAASSWQNKSRPWENREWLYRKYVKEGKPSTEIASECEASFTTIVRWLDKHDIEKRGSGPSPSKQEEKKYTTEEWLRREYIDKQRPSADIAEECGVAPQTIRSWLVRFEIPTRSRKEAKNLSVQKKKELPKVETEVESEKGENTSSRVGNKSYTGPKEGLNMSWSDLSERNVSDGWVPYRDAEWLQEAYHENGMTQKEIADLCDIHVSTVVDWMEKHGIETRNGPTTEGQYQDEAWLREMYYEKGLNQYEIAERCDVSHATINRWMKKHGIDARN